ncbi:hypothetical protein MC885_013641 [Smutsia gigantea]|nr:hypothetical protein MC885_013641 [Smutsia gigantea]
MPLSRLPPGGEPGFSGGQEACGALCSLAARKWVFRNPPAAFPTGADFGSEALRLASRPGASHSAPVCSSWASLPLADTHQCLCTGACGSGPTAFTFTPVSGPAHQVSFLLCTVRSGLPHGSGGQVEEEAAGHSRAQHVAIGRPKLLLGCAVHVAQVCRCTCSAQIPIATSHGHCSSPLKVPVHLQRSTRPPPSGMPVHLQRSTRPPPSGMASGSVSLGHSHVQET